MMSGQANEVPHVTTSTRQGTCLAVKCFYAKIRSSRDRRQDKGNALQECMYYMISRQISFLISHTKGKRDYRSGINRSR